MRSGPSFCLHEKIWVKKLWFRPTLCIKPFCVESRLLGDGLFRRVFGTRVISEESYLL
jgi:hypothetical protein